MSRVSSTFSHFPDAVRRVKIVCVFLSWLLSNPDRAAMREGCKLLPLAVMVSSELTAVAMMALAPNFRAILALGSAVIAEEQFSASVVYIFLRRGAVASHDGARCAPCFSNGPVVASGPPLRGPPSRAQGFRTLSPAGGIPTGGHALVRLHVLECRVYPPRRAIQCSFASLGCSGVWHPLWGVFGLVPTR